MKFAPILIPFISYLVPQTLATTTTTTTIPPTPIPALSTIQWTSTNTTLDTPKVHPVNATTWEWWYFDAIQTSEKNSTDQAAFIATFYTALPSGFDPLIGYHNTGFTSLTLAEMNVVWPDGTVETVLVNATEAVVTLASSDDGEGNAVTGVWDGGNGERVGFRGSEDLMTFTVDVDVGEGADAVQGRVVLESIAPPHCPCAPATAGQTLEIAPHVGWTNAVPSAIATVDLSVRRRPLRFTGIGYHDKNFGSQPFSATIGSWYWGHGQLGPYTVTWFDVLTTERKNYVSAYIARDNKIINTQCEGVKVRPVGGDETYPPRVSSGLPGGFVVNITIPNENDEGDAGVGIGEELQGNLDFTAEVKYVLAGGRQGLRYTRWMGKLEGVVGGEVLRGDAMFEQFNFFQ